MAGKAFRSHHLWSLGWPSLTVLLLGGWLWFLWPGGSYTTDGREKRIPEAGAAYVLHDPRSTPVYMKPDLFARPSRLGFAQALPDSLPEYPFEPYLVSPPLFLEEDQAAGFSISSPPLPSLREPPDLTGRPLLPLPPPFSTGTVLSLSPGLQRSNLAPTLPEDLPGEGSWRLRLYLEPAGEINLAPRIFSEAQGLSQDQIEQWIKWARKEFAGRGDLRGFMDLSPGHALDRSEGASTAP